MLIDMHLHTVRSHHGEGDLIDFIEAGINLGYSVIGFNEHAPYIFDQEHRLSFEELDKYIEDILKLKNKYHNSIRILVGLEVDFHPNNIKYIESLLRNLPLDYCTGAVHFLNSNSNKPSIWDYCEFHDRNLIKNYFKYLREAVQSRLFNYIVHPDLILRTGLDPIEIDNEIYCLIELMKKYQVGYEINCSGLTKTKFNLKTNSMSMEKHSYPCLKYVKEAVKMGIPLFIGSDAHSVRRLGSNINEVLSLIDTSALNSIQNTVTLFLNE